jgi:toxin ParE1/3/4
MTASVHKRASAKRDLVEHYVYLAEHAGIETAERFLLSADKSFGDLGQHPQMGVALSLRDPKLARLRKWRVSGFENFLIFYLPRPDGVSIVRVLHAAKDWWSLLGIL